MRKNVSGQVVEAQMTTAADGSAFTGTVTVYVTGDGGTQTIGSVGSGICTHEGKGLHSYLPSQAETNYDHIAFTFEGTGAITTTVQVYTRFDANVTHWLGTAPLALSSQQVQAIVPDTQKVDVNTIKTQSVTLSGGVTIPAATLASTTNITAGTVTTATNVTTVNGLAAGVITAASIDADAITAAKVAADVTTEIQSGLATAAELAKVPKSDGTATWNATALASINAEADTALSDYGALKPTTAGRTLDVTATGAAGVDWGNVENTTTTVGLSGTTISTSQAVASVSGAVGSVTGAVGSVTGNVGGNVAGSVGSVTGNVGGNVTGSIGSLATQAKADVNAEADQALSDYGALKPTTAGRTLDVTATGAAGIDWSNVESPTTAVDLSGTTISTSQSVASVSGAVASVTGAVGSVTGNVGGNVVGSVASVTNRVTANVDQLGGDAQSLTDLKDFADAGYDPSTNKVQGVVLVDTTTTNTDMRGTDNAALASVLGAAVGASISADIAAVKADTASLLTRVTANIFSGITYLKNWLGALAGKTADTATRAEINATTAGAGYNETTDSLEARADAAIDVTLDEEDINDIADAVIVGLAGSSVEVRSPVLQPDLLELVQGNDYLDTDGRAIQFTISGISPDYTAGSCVLYLRKGDVTLDITGSITTATGPTRVLEFEMTAVQTATLPDGVGRFEVEVTLANTHVLSPAIGKLRVLEQIEV